MFQLGTKTTIISNYLGRTTELLCYIKQGSRLEAKSSKGRARGIH
jgi:hypothetical protein